MRLDRIVIRPGVDFLNPSILFDANIKYVRGDEAIIRIDGWLESNDNKKISYITEYFSQDSRDSVLSARGTRSGGSRNEYGYSITLITELTDKALTLIENERMKNEKRDVNLKINLNVNYLNNRARIACVHRINPKQIDSTVQQIQTRGGRVRDFQYLVEAYDEDYHSDVSSGWFLSGDNSPEYLEVKNQKFPYNFRIPSTDWIHEYAPIFGLGEFFSIQIPKGKRELVDAWKYVEQAEASFQNWDTISVYANCRECGKLLDKKIGERYGRSSFNYKERWGRFYARFENLASLNLHLEDLKKSYPPEDVQINKPDSEHLLINTKALVKFAEELLLE